jgi:hypothetical protein
MLKVELEYTQHSQERRSTMPLSLTESVAVSELAQHLYGFLPGSGNNVTAFPIAATKVGIADAWPVMGQSKQPAIVFMLTWTLDHRRDRFSALMIEIVQQAIRYRMNKKKLTRQDIERLNQLLLGVRFKIPELVDEQFLKQLPQDVTSANPDAPAAAIDTRHATLKVQLEAIAKLDAHPRGYAFEKFLTNLFDAFRLAPRGSFRIVGEQIDGSFKLENETFLLEAKWEKKPIDAATLRSFNSSVTDKSRFGRGLFISESGFSEDGLTSFGVGKAIVLMDGSDLWESLDRKLDIDAVLSAKVRRAAETGKPFVRVRDLFP